MQVLAPKGTVVMNLLVGMTGTGSSGGPQEIEAMVSAIHKTLRLIDYIFESDLELFGFWYFLVSPDFTLLAFLSGLSDPLIKAEDNQGRAVTLPPRSLPSELR